MFRIVQHLGGLTEARTLVYRMSRNRMQHNATKFTQPNFYHVSNLLDLSLSFHQSCIVFLSSFYFVPCHYFDSLVLSFSPSLLILNVFSIVRSLHLCEHNIYTYGLYFMLFWVRLCHASWMLDKFPIAIIS